MARDFPPHYRATSIISSVQASHNVIAEPSAAHSISGTSGNGPWQ